MYQLPTSEQLLNHQIEHYTKRLNEAATTEAKAFIRKQLWQLKQRKQALLN
jgi:hypothetical protein